MAAADIQVINPGNLQKIESFFNDSAYREAIENSANFNTRLCVERRLRMPFLDPQTGVAQTHCNLFMSRRQRMAGAREGQLYTYPAARWRKAKRQYLSLHRGGWPQAGAELDSRGDTEPEDAGPGPDHDGDSKDSHHKDDAKEWFYDDMTMEELDQLEEPEPDSDEDYCDESYAARRRRAAGATERVAGAERAQSGASKGRRGKAAPDTPEAPGTTPKGRGRGGGRGRKKAVQQTLPYEVAGDADKPYGCELCGARYKTRPGLTYHYTHSHKEGGGGGSDGDSRDSPARTPATPAPATTPAPAAPIVPPDQPSTEYQDSYVTFITGNSGVAGRSSPPPAQRRARRKRKD